MNYALVSLLIAGTISATPMSPGYQHEAAGEASVALISSRSSASGALLDHFSDTDLEFKQWIDHMVEEGQLLRPNQTLPTALFAREGEGWSMTLKNMACSTVTGDSDLLGRAESHFCDTFTKNAEQLLAKQLEMDVTKKMCDGEVCKLGLRTVFDFFGLFDKPDDMTKLCHEMFDGIRNACPSTGGVAEAEFTLDNGGVTTGQVECAYAVDRGSTCSESVVKECFTEDVPV